jgi:CRISPR-associated protein Csx17
VTPVHVHRLDGCTSQPLAHYLKGLAVLRLVAEQADSAARGFWRGEAFHLVSALDREALLDFLTNAYEPTPLVAPWNGGSGFYPKDKKDGIDALASSAAARFAAYAAAIQTAQQAVGGRKKAPKNDEKEALLQRCRDSWTGPVTEWLDAAYVLTADGTVRYPAVLGTGGNDGRLDFTNNFMQRLVELFDPATGAPRGQARALLEAALFGATTNGMISKAVGQFLPGGAGGANASSGFSGDSLFNPWDFVLMLEGALLLEVAAVRRLESHELPQAAAPFAVRGRAAGYASAAGADEGSRGEQWFPLWSAPSTVAEVQALFDEGRMRVGRRDAQSALDAARALARLGVARGVDAFERYGYIERNGQANLAVPLGRWSVVPRPRVRLLDEIDGWVYRLRRAAGQTGIGAMERAARRIDDAMLQVCREDVASAWSTLLERLGEAEDMLRDRPRTVADQRLRPLPRLSPGWADVLEDSAEVRIAKAIASQYDPSSGTPSTPKLGSIRRHCLPLTVREDRFATTEGGFVQDASVVWTGRDLVEDLATVALRRAMEARRLTLPNLKLVSRHPAPLEDLQAWVMGALDDRRIAALARPLMAVRWWEVERSRPTGEPPVALAPLGLFKVLFPHGTPFDHTPRPESDILRLLVAGRLEEASRRAARRLVAHGLRPKLDRVVGSPELARRLAAAVLVPLSPSDQRWLLERTVRRPPDSTTEEEATAATTDA